MDCRTVRKILVPYCDEELAPADAAWVAEHLEVCPSCASAHSRVAAQSHTLAKLPPPPLPEAVTGPMWAAMDEALEAELAAIDRAAPAAPQAPPPSPARTGSSRVAYLSYAALLLLALAWGWSRHEAAAIAEGEAHTLRQRLEQLERRAAAPAPLPEAGTEWRPVAYTRGRGHL